MKNLIYNISRTALWLMVTLLVVLAITISLGRELLQDVNSFRSDIERFASDTTALNFSAGALQGEWAGMRPELVVTALTVRKQPDAPVLFSAQEIKLQWMMLASLLNLEPRFNVWVEGATLELVYQDGFLLPAGIAPPNQVTAETDNKNNNENNFRLVDFINRQPHLELSNSQLTIDGFWSKKATFNHVNLLMVNRLGHREIDGHFLLSGPSESKVQLFAQVQGSLVNLNTLQGQYYVNVDNASLVPWIPEQYRHLEHLEIASAEGAVEIWARIKHGVIHRVTANLALEKVSVNNNKEATVQVLDVAKGTALYRYIDDKNAQIVLSDFYVENELFSWNPKLLSLNAEQLRDKVWSFDLLLDDVDIDPWVQYYVGLADSASRSHEVLSAISPKGVMKDLHAKAMLNDGELESFYVSGALRGFEMKPHGFFPGVNALDANIEISEKESFVSIASEGFILDYPALFRNELSFDWLDAQLKLTALDDGFLLETGVISLNNSDIRTATQLSLQFPSDESASPRIKTQSTLRGVELGMVETYLPAGILREGLVSFLDGGIKSGHMTRGDIIFNGPLVSKKQEENLNMQLGFVVDDTVFQFLPDWKPVSNVQADIIVDRVFVDVYAIAGSYYGATIDQALVTTRRDDHEDPFLLSVKALVNGDAAQGLNVLQQSPLRSKVGGFVDTITLNGDMALGLDLSLLLAEEPDVKVDVDFGIQQGVFALPAQRLQLDGLAGDFTFDLVNGLRANKVKAVAFGGELEAAILPVFDTTTSKLLSTRVDMLGEAELNIVSAWLKSPAMKYLEGRLSYEAMLDLPMAQTSATEGTFPPSITIRSLLSGVDVLLPEPFYKEAHSERSFYLNTTLGADLSLFSLRYGDLIDVKSEVDDHRLTKLAVALGGEKAVLPLDNGYEINGHLDRLDVKEWVDAIFVEADERIKAVANVGGQPFLIEETLLDGRLGIESLSVFGQEFPNMILSTRPSIDAWDVRLAGEGLNATFMLPKYLLSGRRELNEQITPLVAEFSTLNIKRPSHSDAGDEGNIDGNVEESIENKNEGKTEDDPATIISVVEENVPEKAPLLANLDPSILPPMKLTVNSLQLDDDVFGRWDLTLSPIANGMAIEPLNFRLKETDFVGVGRWIKESNDEIVTEIKGKASAENVFDVMKAWGAVPSLDSDSASAVIDASWRGAPFEFDMLTADASVSIKISDGHFLNVNSGAVDKVWGALNFQTILKRLQLNFTDLSSKDLTFSDIKGDLILDNQVLTIKKMVVDSPAVDMVLKGDLLLGKKELDMKLGVTIPVTRNLVLPAAAVGGLPAAATAFVIEKMLGDQLNKLTTIEYDVVGSFDEPEVRVNDSFSVIPKPVQESIIKTDKSTKPRMKAAAPSKGKSVTVSEPDQPLNTIKNADSE